MKTLIHIIPSMGYGGAEIMLAKLLNHRHSKNNMHLVISLLPSHESINTFPQDNITQLDLKRRPIWSLYKMITLVFKHRDASLVGWLYIGCLFSYILSFFSRKNARFYIHHSLTDLTVEKRKTRILVRLLSFVSKGVNVEKIIFVSELSYNQHIAIGYCKEKSTVIYNGIDRDRFASKTNDHVCSPNKIVIGSFGRFHPVKDHELLFSLIREISTQGKPVELHLAGVGIDKDNIHLKKLIETYAIEDSVILHGIVPDIENIYELLDVYILSSKAESFPNVILEAMCYGILIVSTDVGDVNAILKADHIILDRNDLKTIARRIIAQYQIGRKYRYEKFDTILTENFDDKIQTFKLIEAL